MAGVGHVGVNLINQNNVLVLFSYFMMIEIATVERRVRYGYGLGSGEGGRLERTRP